GGGIALELGVGIGCDAVLSEQVEEAGDTHVFLAAFGPEEFGDVVEVGGVAVAVGGSKDPGDDGGVVEDPAKDRVGSTTDGTRRRNASGPRSPRTADQVQSCSWIAASCSSEAASSSPASRPPNQPSAKSRARR